MNGKMAPCFKGMIEWRYQNMNQCDVDTTIFVDTPLNFISTAPRPIRGLRELRSLLFFSSRDRNDTNGEYHYQAHREVYEYKNHETKCMHALSASGDFMEEIVSCGGC